MKTKRLNTGPFSCAKWLAAALVFCGFGVSYGFEPTDSYTYGFWLGNPRLVNSADDYRFVVQTDRYGLLINVGDARIERLGVARPAKTQRQALRAGSDWISTLPDVVPWVRFGRNPGDVAWSAALVNTLLVLWEQYGDASKTVEHWAAVRGQLANVAAQASGGMRAMHTRAFACTRARVHDTFAAMMLERWSLCVAAIVAEVAAKPKGACY